ncbi:MAG: hypothetical protein HY827_00450 [Actinobacteria bacterium]|nr:hypothetical protein [Actinomycetota bacterium]
MNARAWIKLGGLGAAGLVFAAVLAALALQLVSQPIGLSSEPVTAGDRLVPRTARSGATGSDATESNKTEPNKTESTKTAPTKTAPNKTAPNKTETTPPPDRKAKTERRDESHGGDDGGDGDAGEEGHDD